MSYDPSEEKYWDPEALDLETRRVFEVCHGCRMCFKYCDSFPDLFSFIDAKDGDVEALDAQEIDKVVDGCFQCKLCEVQCPYTPRDGHEFQLDFPKLIHRHAAVRAKEKGIPFRERVLGDPDALGALGRSSLGLANTMNKVRLHRWFMEKVLGVHRDKLLPDFASETFETWAERSGRIDEEPSDAAVVFQTCYVQNNEPQIGRDTLEVLDRNQLPARCVRGLECCGMPAWEHGDLEGMRRRAHANIERLAPHVEAGAKVVVINPTCAMMMRREYPELVDPSQRAAATELAAAVVDPGELVWSIRKEDRFNTDFASSPEGKVAYHAPCHLRAQAVGFRGRDLLRKLPGVDGIATTMECCGHDGTYAMKVESFEASKRIGKKSFEGLQEAEASVWVTECPLAALQFEQHAGRRALHPMTALARAYRGEAFEGGGDGEAGDP